MGVIVIVSFNWSPQQFTKYQTHYTYFAKVTSAEACPCSSARPRLRGWAFLIPGGYTRKDEKSTNHFDAHHRSM